MTRSFKGYSGQSEINSWVVTDTHGISIDTIKAACKKLPNQSPDIVFMLGDIITYLYYKQITTTDHSICYIFKLADALTSGTRPIVYARGNHETRAAYSTYLKDYIGGDTGELYFTYTYGPISSIVLDFGEDKVDTHHEYTGFANFREYNAKQTEWLNALDGYPKADTATYKLAISHGNTVKNHYAADWMSPLTEYGSDLMISGHTHTYALYVPEGYSLAAKTVDNTLSTLVNGANGETITQYGAGINSHVTNFPHMICGAHYGKYSHFIASQLTFKNGQIITRGATDTQAFGTTFTINAGLNEEAIIEGPGEKQPAPAYRKPDYYDVNTDNKVGSTTLADDTNFKLITKPVVFDTGDNYTVVWASTEGTTATAEVRVHIDGAVYKFADQISGYSNYISNTMVNYGYCGGSFYPTKNIHTAVVQKEYLEQGKYECVTQHLSAAGYTTNVELGCEVSTGLIDFDGYDDGEDVDMLFVSQWNGHKDMVSKLRTPLKNSDVLVLGGNIAEKMQSTTDLQNLIYSLGSLTSGKKPVYFARGASELNGAFAPYLNKALRTDTNEFYAKVSFGPVSSIILDTAAAYDDSYAAYNNMVHFEAIRAKQLDWLAEQSYDGSKYNVVFSSVPELFDNMGTDYNRYLNAMGADIAVAGSADASAFTAAGSRGQNYATVSNGSYGGDGTVATKLSFKNGVITVSVIGDNAAVLSTNTVNVKANDTTAYSDVSSASWYADAANYASIQTLMVGTSATTFAPEETVTRGQAAVVLANLANADLETADIDSTPFTDVDENAYYAKAVAWCYENKVTVGTAADKFSPEQSLTREMLCALVCNLYGESFPQADDCDFTDFDAVSDYAKASVAALAKAGVIVGMGDGRFAPKADVTRAQLAQILYVSKL